MNEPVRLVIWDLDDTFWRGTVTEGGFEYRQQCHDTVIALAKRGIMSSICSKNDPATVEPILRERGIWDYFIFPNISWYPKGPRIASMIETIGLRNASCLFIDDNPANRSEAAHFAPGLQVSDPGIIALLLQDVRCTGKDDSALTRLAQYKTLEQRNTAQAAAGTNVEAFLRASNIRVEIEHDVAAHLDRAIELINRTNQLNFTKKRLPENIEEARRELLREIEPFDVHAALIRVTDDYGDYGYCGLYVMHRWIADTGRHLIHYCFSCRILGMGIEYFIYDFLQRPRIALVGPVLADLPVPKRVDWVSMGPPNRDKKAGFGRPVFLHGGCDMMNVAHYAATSASEVVGEYDIVRHGISIRTDHTLIARYAIQGATADVIKAGAMLGYEPSDFESPLLTEARDGLWVLSFAADGWVPVWRHNATGLKFPFVFTDVPGILNPLDLSAEKRKELIRNPALLDMIGALEREFTYCGPIDRATFTDCVEAMLSRIPSDADVMICYPFKDKLYRWLCGIADGRRNVRLQLLTDLNTDGHAVRNNHFDRIVYYRLYQAIEAMASGGWVEGTKPTRLQRWLGFRL